ncbi:DUF4347 domain-containing protein [Azospirillum thermophilum]|uniref:DUF4347 domain-containing protein n=1 Tax=Azospirillum thermophilum TaxID=2202148 RepID=A0A2S2CX99_9PROT|nr:DUF4347 domain-containing protein [Azospirillum thermophilum]AWK89143.1 hypothetical protein DEW08_24425 [Azospirillum thermophilum]
MALRNSLKIVLEPRYVFDGAAVATVAESIDKVIDQTHRDPAASQDAAQDAVHAASATAAPRHAGDAPPAPAEATGHDTGSLPAAPAGQPAAPPAAPVHEIVFVDSRVDNLPALTASVPSGVEVVVLDPARDGIGQITGALAGRTNLDAIHIVSQGSAGALPVGRDLLTSAALVGRADEVASWRDHLADGGGIGIHGLESAGSAGSRLLTDTLSNLTGLDVEVTEAAAWSGSVPADGPASPGRTLLVVDYRVTDVDTLLGYVDSKVEVLRLDGDDDALTAIGAALSHGGYGSLQIISHGASGELLLGRDTLTADSLRTSAAALSAWRSGLTEDADILIYGCDVAAGEAGARFIASMAELTGADVAASVDATGAAAFGATGPWRRRPAPSRRRRSMPTATAICWHRRH